MVKMSHFNHNYTAGIPDSVGDRFYAQDLNDDFNYLKHLPYERLFKGKSGVIIYPDYEWNASTKMLTFTGGVGASVMNCTVVNTDETWAIPPKTKQEPRYERVEFVDSVLDLTNNTEGYIVAAPVKKSLLERTKALVGNPYSAHIKYTASISVAPTPTVGIVLGYVKSSNSGNNVQVCLWDTVEFDSKSDRRILKDCISTGVTPYFPAVDFTDGLPIQVDTDKVIEITSTYRCDIVDSHFKGVKTISLSRSGGNTKPKISNTRIDFATSMGNGNSFGGNMLFEDCTITLPTYYETPTGTIPYISDVNFVRCTINITPINKRIIKSSTLEDCTINIADITDTSKTRQIFSEVVARGCKFNVKYQGLVTQSGYNSGISGINSWFFNCTFDNCEFKINKVLSGILFHNTFIHDTKISIEEMNISDEQTTGFSVDYPTILVCCPNGDTPRITNCDISIAKIRGVALIYTQDDKSSGRYVMTDSKMSIGSIEKPEYQASEGVTLTYSQWVFNFVSICRCRIDIGSIDYDKLWSVTSNIEQHINIDDSDINIGTATNTNLFYATRYRDINVYRYVYIYFNRTSIHIKNFLVDDGFNEYISQYAEYNSCQVYVDQINISDIESFGYVFTQFSADNCDFYFKTISGYILALFNLGNVSYKHLYNCHISIEDIDTTRYTNSSFRHIVNSTGQQSMSNSQIMINGEANIDGIFMDQGIAVNNCVFFIYLGSVKIDEAGGVNGYCNCQFIDGVGGFITPTKKVLNCTKVRVASNGITVQIISNSTN